MTISGLRGKSEASADVARDKKDRHHTYIPPIHIHSSLRDLDHDSFLDPFGTQILVHQKAIAGNIKISRGMRSHLTSGDFYDISYGGVVNGHRSDGPHSWLIPSDRWDDIEDWHWACQLQPAQVIRFGVEYMRSLEPLNAGTLV